MTGRPFRASFQVAWQDLDANAHMKNTRYLDYAAQTRFLFFAANGLSFEAFRAAAIGPAVLEERITYRRELRFLDRFEMGFLEAARNASGSHFAIENQVWGPDGQLCARIWSRMVWFDLTHRKVTVPPAPLAAAMDRLQRTADFEVLTNA
jgi:acyl-CoA thioester hydrolase